MLEAALVLAALLIGATGTFSPCGLSAIETIGPTGHGGGRRTTFAACAAFAPGALAGGLATFGLLALAGDALHGAGGDAAYWIAAAVAAFAALLEVRGTRIVPQIRRQLPEHWRRVMPMPLAGGLYGVLLGLGFTTFVLSFGVWALAGISLALGDPALGLLIGAGFGVGRALPVVALAPYAGRPAGIRATELMCETPAVYLGLRRGDAAALAATALALVIIPGTAGAESSVEQASATDPSTAGADLAFEPLAAGAIVRQGGADNPLPGSEPAVGGAYAATIEGGSVRLFARAGLTPVASIPAPGADAIAVSDRWLVYRTPLASGDAIVAIDIANPNAPAPPATVESSSSPSQLSRPALEGDTLLFGVATPDNSRIVERTLGTSEGRTLVSAGRLQLFNPAVAGGSFVYTRTDSRHSRLMYRSLDGRGAGHVLLSVRQVRAQLWTTALSGSSAFATVLAPGAGGSSIVEVPLSDAKRRGRLSPRPFGGGNHKL